MSKNRVTSSSSAGDKPCGVLFDAGPFRRDAAVEDDVRPGTPPIDPRILRALWLYATLRGVGSARKLARRRGEWDEIRING